MQALLRKSKEKSTDKSKEDKNATKKKDEEKLKKLSQAPTTPRNYVHPAKTTDIYSRTNTKAPKKSGTTQVSNTSPMKNLLNSSNSTVSNLSHRSKSLVDKRPIRAMDVKVGGRKSISVSNVTVKTPTPIKKRVVTSGAKEEAKEVPRERRNTRTLPEEEVKMLTPEVIDNNAEMARLRRTLKAQPKSFYVELDEGKFKKPRTPPPRSPDASYSDDFESYESDFESCCSSTEETRSEDVGSGPDEEPDDGEPGSREELADTSAARSEEKMLDSGSYELRSAPRSRQPGMAGISEETLRTSLQDEGFQEMSQFSDVLERPMFLDFKKSKVDRKRRLENERLKRRAADLLGMIQLHEMSYNLFEMKPIAYNVYMATFGRNNYVQVATQTFDDGITREIQTDEIICDNKWTQHPVEFSKQEVYLTSERRAESVSDDTFKKFSFMLNTRHSDKNVEKDLESHKSNELRLFLDQKDGAGTDSIMSVEKYNNKMENTQYSVVRLNKFLKRVENRVSRILSLVTGNTTDLKFSEKSDLPFSKGYHKLNTSSSFLQHRSVSKAIFSDTKSNLVLTIHRSKDMSLHKNVICLWDISIASDIPKKVLTSIDDIALCRFRGDTNGIFVSALNDGSIHLWDLSEDTSKVGVASEETTELVENCKDDDTFPKFIQSCAYTSSAQNLSCQEPTGSIVGLEMSGDTPDTQWHHTGYRNLGQVYALQNIGVISMWTIVLEKPSGTIADKGKAYWSKMKLEKHHNIHLSNFLSAPTEETETFNLNAAKTRLAAKKAEWAMTSVSVTAVRAVSGRPMSARRKPVSPASWDSGIVCMDLKVVLLENTQNFLIAKNCGEVVRCYRSAGNVRVEATVVAADKASIVSLAICAPPYFLAASESGALHLCSLLEARVLVTLDCSVRPPATTAERCLSDARGRYVGSAARGGAGPGELLHRDPIKLVCWLPPSRAVTLSGGGAVRGWRLAGGGGAGAAAGGGEGAVVDVHLAGGHMVLVTSSNEAQIHRLDTTESSEVELFPRL